MFKALVLEQEQGKTKATIRQMDDAALPEGDVLVRVDYSSLNYKDGLAVTGKGRIIREFPMIPGIDFVGTVQESQSPSYQNGDKVILTGWGVGESHWGGGMAEKARLNAQWLVPLPAKLDSKKAMIIGTAGFTAMLCVQALVDAGIKPEDGPVLVTGASGGVGVTSVDLLSALGFQVVAVTGSSEQNTGLLKRSGAAEIVQRDDFEATAKPLEKQLWAGAVDCVGGNVLAKVLSQIKYAGAVSACGLAGGFDLPTTVMPFILRGIKLLGIDSVMCPYKQRVAMWDRLAELLPADYYQQVCREVSLAEVPALAEVITKLCVKHRPMRAVIQATSP